MLTFFFSAACLNCWKISTSTWKRRALTEEGVMRSFGHARDTDRVVLFRLKTVPFTRRGNGEVEVPTKKKSSRGGGGGLEGKND